MKVLLVHAKDARLPSPSDPPDREGGNGGISVHLTGLVQAMRDRGWTVGMIRFVENAKSVSDAPAHYYELRSVYNRVRPGVRRSFREILKREDPDVVHVHSVFHSMSASMLDELARTKPLVYTLHDVTPICYWSTKLRRDGRLCDAPVGFTCLTGGCYQLGACHGAVRDVYRLVRDSVRLAGHRRLPVMTVPSGYLRKQLIVNRFPPERIRVVPGFSRFADCNGTSSGLPKNKNILFVGRLVVEKGILEVVRALGLLRAMDWQATIIGEGPALAEATRLVEEKKLSSRVQFVGPASPAELHRHYENCFMMVMPSLIPESFGMVGVEAMSFSRPVVAYASGGVTEWMQDEVNGFLVEHGNFRRLAERMDRLLADRDLATRMGHSGREQVSARFGVRHHVDLLEGAFQEAADRFARARQ